MFNTIPNSLSRIWLLFVNFLQIIRVKSEKIYQFTSGINLCLKWIFALLKHCCGIQCHTIFCRKKFRCSQKDRDPCFPGHCCPFFSCIKCRFHNKRNLFFASFMILRKKMLMIVRTSTFAKIVCLELFSVNYKWDFNFLRFQSCQLIF